MGSDKDGVKLWTPRIDYNVVGVLRYQRSGGSRGGAAPPLLFLGQTEA